MATINLASLSRRAPVNGTPFTYSDLELDMKLTNTQSYPVESTLKKKDVVADYDLEITCPDDRVMGESYEVERNDLDSLASLIGGLY